jgi:hypothetical protein
METMPPSIAAEATPASATAATAKRAPFATLYAVTIFLSAFLLFHVQLIIGKYILPWFGGSASVWNSCLLFFQILLLLGYLYAHFTSQRFRLKPQTRLHLLSLLASLAVLTVLALHWSSPITPGPIWKPLPGTSPELRVALVLALGVGFPFLILSTTGPLLQVWLSRAQLDSPYRLYAWSNTGSLLGLLSYPFFEERWLLLRTQAWLWSAGYALFLLAYAACSWTAQKHSSAAEMSSLPVEGAGKPKISLLLLWLALTACASVMLLATTNLICQEVAVVPLLWVLPLCIYLLTFILCFAGERWYRRAIFHPLYVLAFFASLLVLSTRPAPHILIQIGVFSVSLFAVCMVCHGELVKSKPSPGFLSSFYLAIAAGGALGSIFVVLVAPRVFQQFWEFQLAFLFCGLLLVTIVFHDKQSWLHKGPAFRVLLYAVVFALMFQGYSYGMALIHRYPGALVALRTRNFFGVKAVLQDQLGNWLLHGQIRHGVQLRDPAFRAEPTLYYKRQSGVGLILDHYPRFFDAGGQRRALRVGVIGLGVGTLAAYGHPGDYFRFYEIDPQVLDLSLGAKPWFTFLQDSPAKMDIVLNDARLSLEREAAAGQLQKFDLLVLDAFSSDSIPVHLLTKEAMALYLRHLSGPDSVIAFHLSNRGLDLRPVAYGLSREYGLTSVEVEQPGFSDWVLASPNPDWMKSPELQKLSTPVTVRHPVPLWTDEYSNLWDVVRPIHQANPSQK